MIHVIVDTSQQHQSVTYRCIELILWDFDKKQFVCSGPKETKRFDLVVVGGGIIGTASARELQLRYPEWNVAVVEKESRLAAHQSSHSSGVIHAGVYYTPGSLKAKLCVEGMQLMYNYLDENRIPYKKVGKLIVATNAEEVSGLEVSSNAFKIKFSHTIDDSIHSIGVTQTWHCESLPRFTNDRW